MVKWGIIGAGNIAHSFAKDFKYVQEGQIRAVASRSIIKGQAFGIKHHIDKVYSDYTHLYHDPEVQVVYVATPHNFHLQNCKDALNAGKAVVCEKPICTNAEDLQILIDLAAEKGTYLMEALWTYFLPAINTSLDWINAGKIGRISTIKANFGFKAHYDPEHRLFNPELAGGALLDIGIYPLALCWLLLKQLPY